MQRSEGLSKVLQKSLEVIFFGRLLLQVTCNSRNSNKAFLSMTGSGDGQSPDASILK